jgi:hypothetical protein
MRDCVCDGVIRLGLIRPTDRGLFHASAFRTAIVQRVGKAPRKMAARRPARFRRQSLDPPGCHIRHDDVGGEVEFRFAHKDPTTRAFASALERRSKLAIQCRLRRCMLWNRPRMGVQRAMQYLCNQMRWNRFKIGVGCVTRVGGSHCGVPTPRPCARRRGRCGRG